MNLILKKIKKLKVIFKNSEEVSKDKIIQLHRQLKCLVEEKEVLRNNNQAKDLLGSTFKGEETDISKLETIIKLRHNITILDQDVKEAFLYIARGNSLKNLETLILKIIDCESKAVASLDKIALKTKSEPKDWLSDNAYADFSKRMEGASKDRDGLINHSRFVCAKNSLPDEYKSLIEAIPPQEQNNICEIVEALVMLKMAEEIYKNYEGIKIYGPDLNIARKNFQKADRQVIELSRLRLQSTLYNVQPSSGNYSVLKDTISKNQQHLSVRNIIKKAAKDLLELKPCWMMSPLEIAKYLPSGEVEFDLVIIDEASQMTPENAVGALVRAKQAMIVGDVNQLPPTSFFQKIYEDEEIDENEKIIEESILDMANSRFEKHRLLWHYRSKHSSLISFSNKHIYNNELTVFPSSNENNQDMGVSYVSANGIYSSGTNIEEAKVMAKAIDEFMMKHKNKSLGVVLLNHKQRTLLEDEIHCVLAKSPHIREYIEKWEKKEDGLQSFFIKSLENVQGDERDVIFIGTVYGPEKQGERVKQRFGPINGIAGKRRLNVLFSRSKEQIVTFSSMVASDIEATEGRNPGGYMLKCWLEYIKSGVLESGQYTGKEPDSPFEEHVIQQVRSMGYEAISQVGVKGYFIDIGVKHSDWPHGFIMGIECDGATYHSSSSARERDRLRQEVLEGLGWNLYRVWSTDWFEDSERESRKLKNAIEARLRRLISDEKKT